VSFLCRNAGMVILSIEIRRDLMYNVCNEKSEVISLENFINQLLL
jgi:hypothetical protein